MPSAPPVTTTTLPATCIVTPGCLRNSGGENEIEHGGVVAGRAPEPEAVPNPVLKTHPLPGMEDHPSAVQHAARNRDPHRHPRQRRHYRIVEHEAAPAHCEVKADRQPVVTARQHQLDHDP